LGVYDPMMESRAAARRLLLPAVLGTIVAACSAAPGASGLDASTPGASSAPGRSVSAPVLPPLATVPPTPGPVVGEVPDELVAAARADLSGLIGADAAAAAVVVVAEAVTWPDGSLGCPVPGEMYVQVETPGYRLILRSGGTEYDYRLTAAGALRLCDRGLRPVP
jgi:hypothetical protein